MNYKTDDISKIQRQLFHSAWIGFMLNNSIKAFFKNVIKKDCFTTDSDYFLLQYFYLVELYKKFDDEKQIIIITHG